MAIVDEIVETKSQVLLCVTWLRNQKTRCLRGLTKTPCSDVIDLECVNDIVRFEEHSTKCIENDVWCWSSLRTRSTTNISGKETHPVGSSLPLKRKLPTQPTTTQVQQKKRRLTNDASSCSSDTELGSRDLSPSSVDSWNAHTVSGEVSSLDLPLKKLGPLVPSVSSLYLETREHDWTADEHDRIVSIIHQVFNEKVTEPRAKKSIPYPASAPERRACQ